MAPVMGLWGRTFPIRVIGGPLDGLDDVEASDEPTEGSLLELDCPVPDEAEYVLHFRFGRWYAVFRPMVRSEQEGQEAVALLAEECRLHGHVLPDQGGDAPCSRCGEMVRRWPPLPPPA